jgi:uncharacterized membrane protein
MSPNDSQITLIAGLTPEPIELGLQAGHRITLENSCDHAFTDLKLTVSFYDEADNYLDFQEFEIEDLAAHSNCENPLNIKAPKGAVFGAIDLEGIELTFLKRHRGKLSTVVILIWGLIVLSRRL